MRPSEISNAFISKTTTIIDNFNHGTSVSETSSLNTIEDRSNKDQMNVFKN